ncbi:uncharacterized protein LOC109794277, partial [Cajanus cajan]|uniref:uncharacterized protein LOC109794277 n=1 Tax=Cajanus cajan TaxID=3821 RepID=UPI00098DADDC
MLFRGGKGGILRKCCVMRGFLGFTGYHRRFVRWYGTITRPFTDMLKKDNFVWTDKAKESFQQLKTGLMTALVLALLDFNKTFIVEVGASRENNAFFVVVDQLSKVAHLMTLTHPYTVCIVAQAFMDTVFILHGIPKSIVSDRDPIFLNTPKLWPKWIPLVEWWYNTTFHTTINATPYEIVCGQPPSASLPYLPGESNVELLNRSLTKREEILK